MSLIEPAPDGPRTPYMNWRPPTTWTAVVLLVEPDHLLLRDVGGGGVLLPGGPVRDGQTPLQAARSTLAGPGGSERTLLPAVVYQRQMTRRVLYLHTFISEPLPRTVADTVELADSRSRSLILQRSQAWNRLPAIARLYAQFAIAARESEVSAYVEWRPWLRPRDQLGVPTPRVQAERASGGLLASECPR